MSAAACNPDHPAGTGVASPTVVRREPVEALSDGLRQSPVRWQSRPMRLADLDAVMDIEAQCYAFPWSRGNFIDALAAGYPAHLLLDAGGRPVGHAVAMVGVEELHVLNIAVAPTLQRAGGGRHLLDLLIGACGGCGARAVWLEVRVGNLRAQRVYARAGFTNVGRRRGYYPAADGQREDAVVMRRHVGQEQP